MKSQGDVDGALRAYAAAIVAGDPEVSALASTKMGMLLSDVGDVDGARAAYQSAARSGYRDIARIAADGLGLLAQEYGDMALQPGANAIPAAAFKHGKSLLSRGNVQEAWDAFYEAIRSCHPEYGPAAAQNLGVLLDSIGELQGAKEAFERGLPKIAEIAPLELII